MLKPDSLIRMNNEILTAKSSILRGMCKAVPMHYIQINETAGNIVNLKPKWKTLTGFYSDKDAALKMVKVCGTGSARLKTHYHLQPIGRPDSDFGKCQASLAAFTSQ